MGGEGKEQTRGVSQGEFPSAETSAQATHCLLSRVHHGLLNLGIHAG